VKIKSSLAGLFTKNKQRDEKLAALNDILEHGTEDQYVQLLITWNVPQDELEPLLNEFRRQRREKRGLL
jgi:hypothetical protein